MQHINEHFVTCIYHCQLKNDKELREHSTVMSRCCSPSRARCCLMMPAGQHWPLHAECCSHTQAADSSPSAALSALSSLRSRHAQPASSAASLGPTYTHSKPVIDFLNFNRSWVAWLRCRTCDLLNHGFNSRLCRCQVTTLGKLFTHMPLTPSSIIWYQPQGCDDLWLQG